MPLLQVRECPEDIYRRISYAAKNENRTIAQQTVVLLEKSLSLQEANISRRNKLLMKIKNRSIADNIKKANPVDFIREDRDR
ncbi:hypothetical protein [Treponema sp.]|uniref:hypothetical protein n=1 Tax=Treponema sp. TaxID=166 RepID=UPI003FA29838